ncbi:MAG: MbtH family protein [Catenulispora sp.]|nr:MbtH family protein [Catenulispora sp.]
MPSPFDDETRSFLVMVNDEGQYSLWPAELGRPAGWTVCHGPAAREECLAFVDGRWTDMRPASLIGTARR